jgi:predicted Rossmann-fold nucleotide-binding protein
VTCDQIEAWRTVTPNTWITDEMRYETQRERLHALIDHCDAAIALPGGIGTLAEVAEMWSDLQTGAIAKRPLILVGSEWRSVIEKFYAALGEYVAEEYRDLLSFVSDVDEAAEALNET